ncbi:MAG: hypothetical protein IJ309_02420 [Clostridia bacterium]|nr:hypothetical protein [Clostridia bacterium]
MRVYILEVNEKKGIRTNGSGEYHFTNVKVSNSEKDLEGWVTVDATVCHPSKIKKGSFAEMRFSITNQSRVSRFDIIGDKDEEPPLPEPPAAFAPNPNYPDFEDVVDESTGELKEPKTKK